MEGGSAEKTAVERRRLATVIEKVCRSLGVECECPFHLPDGAGGTVEFAVYLADFGGPLGMAVDVADRAGFPVGKGRPAQRRRPAFTFPA